MTTSFLIVILILLVFAAIVALMFLQSSREIKKKDERLAQRGFTPIDPVPPEIVTRIIELQPRKPSNGQVTKLARKAINDGELYVFDLVIPSKNDSDTHYEDSVMVVSPTLRLPRLFLLPLPRLDGKWGGMVNSLVGGIMGMTGNFTGMQRIQFPENPEFNQRFTVLGEDEDQVRAFFNPYRVSLLMGVDNFMMLQTNGDAYEIDVASAQGKSKDEILDLSMNAAIKLLHILQT